MRAVDSFKRTSFDWTMRLDSVWRDTSYDVAELNGELREEILFEFEGMLDATQVASPLGWILKGQGGSGKTHLLGALRKAAAEHKGGFVLVDMTDVHDFWKTVLHGYVNSLENSLTSEVPQYQTLLFHLVDCSGISSDPREFISDLANAPDDSLASWTDRLLGALKRKYGGALVGNCQDSIRALMLLNSLSIQNFNLGRGWLQGLGIDESDARKFGFTVQEPTPMEVVKALSWTMSVRGPTILALDQLDAIVNQHRLLANINSGDEMSEERALAVQIIEGIGGGLSALIDQTRRTVVVVSCQDRTWEALEDTVLRSHLDRFKPPKVFHPVSRKDLVERMVALRLKGFHTRLDKPPEYDTWPFKQEAFGTGIGLSPREILRACENHRLACINAQEVRELSTFIGPGPRDGGTEPPTNYHEIESAFQNLKQQANIDELLHEDNEDSLGLHFQKAFRCLAREHVEMTDVAIEVEGDIAPKRSCQSTHVRIRIILVKEDDREEHFCLRVLQKENPRAYQNRLDAAMTASGIDRNLDFRRLVLIRTLQTHPIPGGSKTHDLTKRFEENGGVFLQPEESELRSMLAISELADRNMANFEEWLMKRKPMSRLLLVGTAVPPLHILETEGSEGESPPSGKSTSDEKQERQEGLKSDSTEETATGSAIPIGKRIIGAQTKDEVSIPLSILTKHTAVLAGAGSGKTVLLKRLIEEAALIGVPSIVVDCQNDLAALGDEWPKPPDNWDHQDSVKARAYIERAEVVVWTPSKQMGNPMRFDPLPDLASLVEDPDGLKEAIDMTMGSLQEMVAPGSSATAVNKQGVLAAALEYFASTGQSGLESFIDMLSDLPPEAGGGISDATKLAMQMADNLRANMRLNPLLRGSGPCLDPSLLFGYAQDSSKTRVSIISLIALPVLSMQQQFLHQLAMTLYSWMKKQSSPTKMALKGLLVIDEAKDFVPSGRTTPCKHALSRLTAQARKYGLGLVYATQYPMDIDVSIMANCSTQFYGRANAPRAIEILREQLKIRGGSGQDIPSLSPGEFYVSCPDAMQTPLKVRVPFCLSHHPANPLDETGVLERARRSRPQT